MLYVPPFPSYCRLPSGYRFVPLKYGSTSTHGWPVLGAGGSTARPTLSSVGSIVFMKALMPALACVSLLFADIDPVRSSTTMTSRGTPPQGEHAWA